MNPKKAFLTRIAKPLMRFRLGIQNLWQFLPVVWKDRPWDVHSLDRMTLHKLRQMQAYFEQSGLCQQNQQTIRQIKTTADLLERVITGYYDLEYEEYTSDQLFSDSLNPAEDSLWNRSGQYLIRYQSEHRRMLRDMTRWYGSTTVEPDAVTCLLISSRNHQRARQLVYKLIAWYGPQWWD